MSQAPSRTTVEVLGVLLVVAGIGWFDYLTGPDIAFSLFYLLPVAAAAWWLSTVAAWASTGGATVVWYVADSLLLSGGHAPTLLFNAMTRFLVLSGAVVAIKTVRIARERERSDALRALQASEARFRNLVESTSDFVWEIDERGRYTYCSPRAYDLLGYQPSELLGRTPFDLMPPEESARHREIFAELNSDPQPIERLENFNLHKSGREILLETSALPICDAAGVFRGYRGIDRDITERKRAEQELLRLLGQLNQAQRMEAIGRLAGGVAHDFNNLLTVILGSADFLRASLPIDHPAREEAVAILDAGQRAAKLTQQLLAFGRRQIREPRPMDLNAVICDMDSLLRRLIGEDIRMEVDLTSHALVVHADPAQFEQVIANLAANARDAMPKGGTLTIATASLELTGAPVADRGNLSPGSYAVLTVSDTGVGMDVETQRHLFEPFFTTKGQTRGTGLGLATVYAIVEQSGGQLSVRSEPSHGSTFEIVLPRIAATAEPTARVVHASSMAQSIGTETILVAEDEEAVRLLFTRYLRQAGYRVLVANLPEQAIELASSAGRIDLLISDVIMPGMSGPELASRLLPTRPDLKVLYVSGYPDTALAQHGVLPARTQLLQKPFSQDDLLARTRAILDRDRADLNLGEMKEVK